jgi:hypothetical protein
MYLSPQKIVESDVGSTSLVDDSEAANERYFDFFLLMIRIADTPYAKWSLTSIPGEEWTR